MVAEQGDKADGKHDGGEEQEENVELAHAVCGRYAALKHSTHQSVTTLPSVK